MRYLLLLTFVSAVIAQAQPSAVIDDLEQRGLLALNSIPRAETWEAAQRSRDSIQVRLKHALGLQWAPPITPAVAFVYPPKNTSPRAPAVIILRPHGDPAAGWARLLPTALAHLGMFVVELDARARHATLNLLGDGATPETLMQQDVRSVIDYLKTQADVDPKRLALVGEGIAATIAAGINAEITAAVVLNGAPDFALMMKDLRTLKSTEVPDSCILLPGLFRYAASQELLSLIAPRPLLLINAANGPLRYATELYGWSGSAANIHHVEANEWNSPAQYHVYAWLARHLHGRSDLTDFVPPTQAADPVILQLAPLKGPQLSTERVELSEHSLSALLGEPLPQGDFTLALNCRMGASVYELGNRRVQFYPQAGINMPVTVLRPGPTGCDASRGTLIAVNDQGRNELVNDEIVREANKRGWLVWMLDPRGIGEMATSVDPFTSAVSLLLREHFPWRQASDILRTLRHVGGATSRYPTAIYARGERMGLAASYVAAIAERRELEWTVLRDAASSFRDMTGSPLSLVPFAALKSFDISNLWSVSKGRIYVIRDPDEFVRGEW